MADSAESSRKSVLRGLSKAIEVAAGRASSSLSAVTDALANYEERNEVPMRRAVVGPAALSSSQPTPFRQQPHGSHLPSASLRPVDRTGPGESFAQSLLIPSPEEQLVQTFQGLDPLARSISLRVLKQMVAVAQLARSEGAEEARQDAKQALARVSRAAEAQAEVAANKARREALEEAHKRAGDLTRAAAEEKAFAVHQTEAKVAERLQQEFSMALDAIAAQSKTEKQQVRVPYPSPLPCPHFPDYSHCNRFTRLRSAGLQHYQNV